MARKNCRAPEGFEGRKMVRGDEGLARIFGVDRSTVYRWRMNNYLDPAIILHVNSVVVYDVEQAITAMHPTNVLQVKRMNSRRYNRFK